MADDKAQNEHPRPRGGDSDSGAKPSAETAKPKVGDSRPAPKIGDSRPAPQSADGAKTDGNGNQNRQSGGNPAGDGQPRKRRRRRGGRGRGRGGQGGQNQNGNQQQKQGGQRQGGRPTPVEAITSGEAVELDEKQLKRRRGRTRKGK